MLETPSPLQYEYSKPGSAGMLSVVWGDIASALGLSRAAAARILCSVQSSYSEPWRAYHGMSHIEELLALSDRHRHLISDHSFVNLSIIFHDIVYYVDQRSSENETNSAKLFIELVGGEIDQGLAARVADAIARTKTHCVPDAADMDLKLFMDFDMAILGAPRTEYSRYAVNIRKEYEAVEEGTYLKARSGFFRNYLSSTPSIYATPLFRESLEAAARANIAWECNTLESGRLISLVDACD